MHIIWQSVLKRWAVFGPWNQSGFALSRDALQLSTFQCNVHIPSDGCLVRTWNSESKVPKPCRDVLVIFCIRALANRLYGRENLAAHSATACKYTAPVLWRKPLFSQLGIFLSKQYAEPDRTFRDVDAVLQMYFTSLKPKVENYSKCIIQQEQCFSRRRESC